MEKREANERPTGGLSSSGMIKIRDTESTTMAEKAEKSRDNNNKPDSRLKFRPKP